MNAERRKLIQQAQDLIGEAVTLLEIARDEEQGYFDNMPEAFQAANKGDKATTAIDGLESVLSDIAGWDFEEILS